MKPSRTGQTNRRYHLRSLQRTANIEDKLLNANIAGKDWNTLINEALAAKKTAAYLKFTLNRLMDATLPLTSAWITSSSALTCGIHFSIMLMNIMNGEKRQSKNQQAHCRHWRIQRESLAKIEKELREAEELKSLKPAALMEALAKRKVERENKEWYEKFRWFTSSDGFLVVAGKDTVSNEVLVKKYTSQEDAVFHAEISGAPFAVVKAEGKTISEQTLHEAGEFAASFSRAWRENAGSADVYWVKLDQLSKSGPSGESVPHGAFAVVGKRNWTRSVPLRSRSWHNCQ